MKTKIVAFNAVPLLVSPSRRSALGAKGRRRGSCLEDLLGRQLGSIMPARVNGACCDPGRGPSCNSRRRSGLRSLVRPFISTSGSPKSQVLSPHHYFVASKRCCVSQHPAILSGHGVNKQDQPEVETRGSSGRSESRQRAAVNEGATPIADRVPLPPVGPPSAISPASDGSPPGRSSKRWVTHTKWPMGVANSAATHASVPGNEPVATELTAAPDRPMFAMFGQPCKTPTADEA